ncbi:LysE/ArgO family amino acid transporter [Acinetobacter pittii]|uniref:LysE/ArgO family amino acid transporter n=1 Tax=Acinetobacter TaxID=469 RepID=UPI0008395E11|nr:LysE/ArgO family amino acid transporter [Acinetobacter pittii]MDR0067599.1 LysE/ArgO family amino acid transporter [Acinetobacter sp. 11520]MBN6529048.1 amino acid transporter [Acinetobacter pittii]MBN6535063.1 amino acid transporter [Acinetobacter pittii]MEB6669802.1 LysE/ArgO family amino acid transporter [Acinetobacter pittii]OCY40365.1 amino acid transporter [Acinetobacter pittii]
MFSLSIFFKGFGIGSGLIVAIGAQNAFVLKQGLKQQYVFWLCLICALSDSILIACGVLGFAEIMTASPILITVAKYLGATFLLVYGAKAFYAAFKTTQSMDLDSSQKQTLTQALVTCLAFTWLNPHVYLDTIVLIGSVATQLEDKVSFALGSIFASWIFFFSLGYGARLLKPLFTNPKAWKILDFIIGCVMWSIAITLLF